MTAKVNLDPNNKFWVNDTEKFGYRMMMKMGWAPGKGLGVNEDGQTKHVAVKVKNDKLGVGVEPTSENWLSACHEYDKALASLTTLTNAVPRSVPESETDQIEPKSKKEKRKKQ